MYSPVVSPSSVEDIIERAMDELERHSPRQKQDEPLKSVTPISVEDVIERAMDELERHSPRQRQDEPLKSVTSLSFEDIIDKAEDELERHSPRQRQGEPSFRQPPRRSSISKVPPPRLQSPPIQIESDFSHITTPSSTSKTRYSLNKAPTQQQGTSVEDVIERAMDELDRHSPRQKQDEPLKRVTSLSPKKRPPPPKR